MVISSELVDSGMFSDHKAAPEKTSFSQTCNLLSQYLKEKGSLGDLSLGMTCSVDANGASNTLHKTGATTTMNLFPQQAEFNLKEEVASKNDFSGNKLGPSSAPMTIFYNGQVIVFNDFPADKAKEIMLLASKGSKLTSTVTNPVAKPAESSNKVSSGSNVLQHHAQRPPQPNVSDLPIARKNSLTRFLEKRKDRITARAPYQTSKLAAAGATPSQPAQSNSWLGLAAQSPQRFQHQI